jgi:integrase
MVAMTDHIDQPADLNQPADRLPAPAIRSNAIKRPKEILSDRRIRQLLKTKAPAGQRLTIWCAELPGFGIRITDNHHSYIFAGRFAGSKHWTRREIAAVDAMTLAAARAKAKTWIELAKQGKDPRAEAERLEREQARKQAHTFAAVAEEFIADRVIGPNPNRPIQRKWQWVCRTIRDPFIATFKERPIADITRHDVLNIITLKKRKHPAEARSQLAIIKVLFGWALNQSYGLERSVCTDIKPKDVIGEKTPRDRALTDDEVRALWTVADRSNYPIGPIYKMLLLSGLRLNEVARAEWPEFDLAKKAWIIPAARMKGRNVGSDGKRAKPHLVPLTPPMLQILESLPRFKSGDLLFTTTKGKKPLWLGSKVKDIIDDRMQEQLALIAAERGNTAKPLEPWHNHDIRRTVRSNLAQLKITEQVGEAILAHSKIGIVATYNVYAYADEKREALELWAARLAEIVNPPTEPDGRDNVVNLREARQ